MTERGDSESTWTESAVAVHTDKQLYNVGTKLKNVFVLGENHFPTNF